MDKLQPLIGHLITHRFWVITGVALVLSIVGWKVGTGTILEEYDARANAINSSLESIPSGQSHPNDEWTEGLGKLNEKQQAEIDRSAVGLWESQQHLMVWPDDMQEEMQQYAYRATNIEPRLADKYRTSYYSEFSELVKILDPYKMTEPVGKCVVNQGGIPRVAQGKWAQQLPTAREMWNSIEDIWLLRNLFETIADANQDARTLAESSVRQLISVQLSGGTGTEISAPTADTGAVASGDYMGTMGMAATYMAATAGFGGGAGGCGGGGGGSFSFDINLADDVGGGEGFGGGAGCGGCGGCGFGCCGGCCGGCGGCGFGGCGGCGGCGGGMTGGCGTDYAEQMRALMGGAGGASGTSGKRYVDDDPELPFKTRAFKLHLVMHIDKIPNYLAILNNAEWPVRILRVHWQSKSPEFRGGSGGSSGGMMGGGGFGTAGGGGFSAPSSGFGAAQGGGFSAPSSGFGAAQGGGFSAPSSGFGAAQGGGFSAPSSGFGAAQGGGFSAPSSGFGAAQGGGFSAPPSGIGGMSSSGFGTSPFGSASPSTTPADPEKAEEARKQAQLARQLYQQALVDDPYLAEVQITGLITIYQPPTEEAIVEESPETETVEPDVEAAGEADEAGETPATVPSADEAAAEGADDSESAAEETPAEPQEPDTAAPADCAGIPSEEPVPLPDGSSPPAEAPPDEGF